MTTILGAVAALSTPFDAVAMPAEPATLDFTGRNYSRLSTAQKRLIADFQHQYARLKGFYDNTTMAATERQFRLPTGLNGAFPPSPDSPLALRRVVDYIFRANSGSYYRLDGVERDPTELDLVKRSRIGIITPSQSYLLGIDTSTGKPFLQAHGNNRTEYMGLLGQYVFHAAAFADGPSLFASLFVNADHYIIDDVAVGTDGVVSMSLSSHGDSWSATSRLRFLRNRLWALKDICGEVLEDKRPDRVSTKAQRCEYDDGPGGVPLLRECVIEHGYREPADGPERIVYRRTFAIQKIDLHPAPMSDFDVRRFVPNIGAKTQTNATRLPFRIACVAMGVALTAVAVILRRKHRATAH